jgi:hypothetical protein
MIGRLDNPTELRQWAADCDGRAGECYDPEERERLIKMRDALFALAREAEWLQGDGVVTVEFVLPDQVSMMGEGR